MAHIIVAVMELEGNKSVETTGSVLQVAQPAHMVDPVGPRFYMAIQHRRIAVHTQLVGHFVYAQPTLRVYFIGSDLLPDSRRKDLCAAPGQTIQSGSLQLFHTFFHTELCLAEHIVKLY